MTGLSNETLPALNYLSNFPELIAIPIAQAQPLVRVRVRVESVQLLDFDTSQQYSVKTKSAKWQR